MIPKFKLAKSPIELGGSVRPGTYCESVGPKAALFGREEGIFEAWVYPFKILHDLELSFIVEGLAQTFRGPSYARRIEVAPEETTIVYSHPLFTVWQTLFVPRDEPAIVMLLDIQSSKVLKIVISFVPDLIPMWPAGLGGQYCLWDEERSAYLILEASKRYAGMVGSPVAVRQSDLIAHEPPGGPVRMLLSGQPEICREKFIPLVIAGSVKGREDAQQTYDKVLGNVPALYQEVVEHYRHLREDFLSVETPDPEVNLAFEWAKVALDKGLVSNPHLGTGLVAGYGVAGTSQRPGFGWFFGGDASVNSTALLSYGDFETVRQALALALQYQRPDGKIPHEISQSAGLIRWFEDYPYAFIHGDTTPSVIAAVGDYYRKSGDAGFVAEHWESLKKAFRWGISCDTDGDGLMENRVAGLGALELGPLLRRETKVDIAVAGVCVLAYCMMAKLAEAVGDEAIRAEAEALYQKAHRSLNEAFWDEARGTYHFALLTDGGFIDEETVWPCVPLAFRLLDPKKSQKALDALESSRLSTGWGTRMLSRESQHYDPMGYNTGAVWPFLTGLVAWAEANYHRAASAFAHWMAMVRLTFADAHGYHHEVLSGDFFRPLDTSVPHQLFSSTGVVTPFIRGLLGLEGDAVHRAIRFGPHLPPQWEALRLKNFRVGSTRFEIELRRTSDLFVTIVRSSDDEPWRFRFAPALGTGAEVRFVKVNGADVEFQFETEGGDMHCQVEATLQKELRIEIGYWGYTESSWPAPRVRIGDAAS